MSKKYSIPKNVYWQAKNDLVVLLINGSDEIIELNETASFIWQQLTTPKTAAQLTSALMHHFSVTEEMAAHDVAEFLEELKTEKLLKIHSTER